MKIKCLLLSLLLPLAPHAAFAADLAARAPAPAPATPAVETYRIGVDDLIKVSVWRNPELDATVPVRPDGKISLPLINEVMAAGLTPEQLRQKLSEQAQRFVEDPNVTVVVKTINSRRVFVIGEVMKPGPYSLMAPTTVLQLISMTGGLQEYADSKNITIMRTENGKPVTYRFNYKDVVKQRNPKQNIELKPGDTIVIP